MPKAARHQRLAGWSAKFRCAFRGLGLGLREQSSFRVHAAAAVAVTIAGTLLRVSLTEWCLLVLCITIVMVAEMFNTALEWMARAVDRRENPRIGASLDVASAAVLLGALGASIVGAAVMLHRLGVILRWWTS
jgi:diacylglycerol kinase